MVETFLLKIKQLSMMMDASILSIFGFGAVVMFGGLIMVGISFFSMKDTTYEAAMKKKRLLVEDFNEEKVKNSKQKRESLARKPNHKKKKLTGQGTEPSGNVKIKKIDSGGDVQEKVKSRVNNESQKKEDLSKVSTTSDASPKATSKKLEEKTERKKLKNSSSDQHQAATKTTDTSAKKEKVAVVVESNQKLSAVDSKKSKQKEKKAKTDEFVSVDKKTIEKNAKSLDSKSTQKSSKSSEKQSKGKTDSKDKIKGVLSNGVTLAETIRSVDLDDDTIFMLIDLLNEKSYQRNWQPADSSSRKAQTLELQRQLEVKNAENSRQANELKQNQLKLKKNLQELESVKANCKTLSDTIDQYNLKNESLKQEMAKKLDEKQQQIFVLQNRVQTPSEVSSMTSLRDENIVLRQTIQENAIMLAKKQDELKLSKQSVEDCGKWQKHCNELELQLADYKAKAQRHVEADTTYSNHVQELELKIRSAEAQYGHLETEFQKTQSDLQIKQSESAKLLEQVTMLSCSSDQHSTMEKQMADTKQELEQRLVELDSNELQRAEEIAKLHTKNKDLLKRAEELEVENKALQNDLLQQRNSANKVVETMQKSSDELHQKDNEISKLESNLQNSTKELSQLQQEIEKLKKKNNELRERNWKAMDAVATAENASKAKIVSSQDEARQALLTMQSDIQVQLTNAFPSISIANKEFAEWIQEFLFSAKKLSGQSEDKLQVKEQMMQDLQRENSDLTTKAKKHESSLSALQQSLDSALKRNKSLEREVLDCQETSKSHAATAQKYKSILASTENILQSLQKSVECEETNKNSQNEETVEELKQQLEKKSRVLEEMKSEHKKLMAECNKVQASKASGDEGKEDQGFVIVDDQPRNIPSDQESEIVKLKERLDKEKELTKSLGEAAKKLQALLKQTQDELNRERKKSVSQEASE